MNLFRRILARFERLNITSADGDVFMVRYRLFMSRWFNVYLHEIRRSDADACLHDHPWHFISIILARGYFEHLRTGRFFRRPGQLLIRPARTAHRIEIVSRPAWSLVFVGPKWRKWGFFTPAGWRPWQPGRRPICE